MSDPTIEAPLDPDPGGIDTLVASLESLANIAAVLAAAPVAPLSADKRDAIVAEALNLIHFGLADVARQVVEPGS